MRFSEKASKNLNESLVTWKMFEHPKKSWTCPEKKIPNNGKWAQNAWERFTIQPEECQEMAKKITEITCEIVVGLQIIQVIFRKSKESWRIPKESWDHRRYGNAASRGGSCFVTEFLCCRAPVFIARWNHVTEKDRQTTNHIASSLFCFLWNWWNPEELQKLLKIPKKTLCNHVTLRSDKENDHFKILFLVLLSNLKYSFNYLRIWKLSLITRIANTASNLKKKSQHAIGAELRANQSVGFLLISYFYISLLHPWRLTVHLICILAHLHTKWALAGCRLWPCAQHYFQK